MSYRLISLVLLAMALHAAIARAEDSAAPMFSFSGFGTLGVVHSSEGQADFTSSFFKPNGAGHRHTWSADVDSLLGAQVTANLTPQLSAVLQVIAEQNHDNSYRPHVEWANIKYQFTPDFSMRVGRIVLPTFLASDYRKVGYANPWVRPPLEVYGLNPITQSDGVDMSYHFDAGEFKHVVRGSYGNNDFKLPSGGGGGVLKRNLAISDNVEIGALTLHAAYVEGRLAARSFNRFFDAFRQFGAEGLTLANKYDLNNKGFSIVGFGASYDPGDWFVMGEGGAINLHSVFGKRAGWYVSSGYRFGKFTPYVTYAQARANHLSDPGLTVSVLPPPLVGPATGLNVALNSFLSAKPVQNTLSVGGRWDFINNASLKLQFDHTRIGAGSSGVLTNIQPGFRLGGKVNVFSAAIDFVF